MVSPSFKIHRKNIDREPWPVVEEIEKKRRKNRGEKTELQDFGFKDPVNED